MEGLSELQKLSGSDTLGEHRMCEFLRPGYLPLPRFLTSVHSKGS